MNILDDRRVSARGNDFLVTISHGEYLLEFDDRDGLWWAYSDGARLRPLNASYPATDLLACSSDACAPWGTAEELVAVLLSFDGEQVPA